MGVYDEDVAGAVVDIQEAGKPIQIVRQTTTTTPGKPWEPGVPSEVLEDSFAVFLNFNEKDAETFSKMEGASELSAADRKVLIAAGSLTSPPTTGDVLRDEAGDWSIEWVQALSPNGQDILYTLRARK